MLLQLYTTQQEGIVRCSLLVEIVEIVNKANYKQHTQNAQNQFKCVFCAGGQ